MQNAIEPLASIFSTTASSINHKDDLIHSVMSQTQIQQFITQYLPEYKQSSQSNELMVQSLTHSSFINEFRHLSVLSYERLEFLGDAVLDLYISQQLLERFPLTPEGKLSKMRGALVNEDSLYEIAKLLELSNLILTGKGEAKKNGHCSRSIMADVFEAILGSLYLSQGLSVLTQFLDDLFQLWEKEKKVNFFDESILNTFDAKSRLQELTMAHFKELPIYQENESEQGFSISCLVQGKVIATLVGESKKKTQRELAQLIIQKNLLNINKTDIQEN